jgi:hypothetical protein
MYVTQSNDMFVVRPILYAPLNQHNRPNVVRYVGDRINCCHHDDEERDGEKSPVRATSSSFADGAVEREDGEGEVCGEKSTEDNRVQSREVGELAESNSRVFPHRVFWRFYLSRESKPPNKTSTNARGREIFLNLT